MQIQTTRFGALDVDQSRVITFAEGLPGFEGCRHFTLVPHPSGTKDVPFEWLQSVDDGALAFLVMDPRHNFPQYAPHLSRPDLEAVGAAGDSPALRLYTLLTVPKGRPCDITANLMAPVIVNPVEGRAKQVVVGGDQYGLRHRLIPEGVV